MEKNESTKIFVDNQTSIVISHNRVFHGKTKHFQHQAFFLKGNAEKWSYYFCLLQNRKPDSKFSHQATTSQKVQFLKREDWSLQFLK